jgi:hypothetical protein
MRERERILTDGQPRSPSRITVTSHSTRRKAEGPLADEGVGGLDRVARATRQLATPGNGLGLTRAYDLDYRLIGISTASRR